MLTPSQQAEFRPLVKRAWEAACRQTGRNVGDILARESWYRSQLMAGAGITSTRQADTHAYGELIHRFLLLSEAGDYIEIVGWSTAQNAQFRKLAEAAWRIAGRRGQTEGQTFTTWLDSHLSEAGIFSRRAPDKTKSFDSAMASLAVTAGDHYWIERTSSAAEIRMRHIIAGLMARLADLLGHPVDWGYCAAIYDQMRLPLTMEEAPAQCLWKVLQALDTHVRRLERDNRKEAPELKTA